MPLWLWLGFFVCIQPSGFWTRRTIPACVVGSLRAAVLSSLHPRYICLALVRRIVSRTARALHIVVGKASSIDSHVSPIERTNINCFQGPNNSWPPPPRPPFCHSRNTRRARLRYRPSLRAMEPTQIPAERHETRRARVVAGARRAGQAET